MHAPADTTHPERESLEQRIKSALAEDIGVGDITAGSVVKYDHHASAEIVVKQPGVICGLEIAEMVFHQLEPRVDVLFRTSDGARVKEGEALIRVEGSGRVILQAERTALNLLSRMIGISTLTSQYVQAVEGTGVRILDTRKTTPLWRDIEKYAVRMGGGVNHRMGLYDMVLIKENHIRWAGGIAQAVNRSVESLRKYQPDTAIEVEIRNLKELDEVLAFEVDRVLLDNMTPEEVRSAVHKTAGKVEVEVSGGITLENLRAYAEAGVDYISVGALTHSARAFDLSLLFQS
ncbi:MAG TPA: carboxylating nicotinate-nucleotide diphosphorylase [bacterium]|nr:carboxylating nicotinate-nucleotide diphosphorylase [bacterium]